MSTLSDLRDIRIQKLQSLIALGINPFPAKGKKDFSNKDFIEKFDELGKKDISLAGRVVSIREHGPLMFWDIEDFTGGVQIYIKKDNLSETTSKEKQTIGFLDLKLVDTGDFVEVTGIPTKTKSGELSLEAKEIKILTKAIRPLPDKKEGLKDKETRFRRRYLDLLVNPEAKGLFIRKAKFWKACRDFMSNEGFIEVETPVMELVTGGADAAPFVTHHNALDQDFYLRISTELYQKRLIGGGFEKIYTIGPNFRNEGIDDEHLQEFYQLEWYLAYGNYRDNMKLTTKLFRYIATEIYGKTKFTKNGMTFDLADEWEEIDYTNIIKEKHGIDIFNDSEDKMIEKLKEYKIKLPGVVNKLRLIDNLWKVIRKDIAGPAFLINTPKFISPLAKSHQDNPEITERFQPIIAGSELANGYSELNDPFDQLERFMEQQKARNAGDDEAQMLDIDFVEMLEYGMPPTSGLGVSERLFWFLEDISAREGTLFPQMKYHIDETTKSIYNLAENVTGIENSHKESNVESKLPTREEAMRVLKEHVRDEYQIMHAEMVAKVMGAYADKFNEDTELWYITGLLHDIDYFEHPEEHPFESLKWFKEWGYPEQVIHAVEAHSMREPRVEPTSRMAAALIAIDELTGFLYAYSLMRPTGFDDMKASSVRKKFKDKAFAAKIDREEILYGIDKFGIDFSEHVTFTIEQLA